jgi:hypothetical protein
LQKGPNDLNVHGNRRSAETGISGVGATVHSPATWKSRVTRKFVAAQTVWQQIPFTDAARIVAVLRHPAGVKRVDGFEHLCRRTLVCELSPKAGEFLKIIAAIFGASHRQAMRISHGDNDGQRGAELFHRCVIVEIE